MGGDLPISLSTDRCFLSQQSTSSVNYVCWEDINLSEAGASGYCNTERQFREYSLLEFKLLSEAGASGYSCNASLSTQEYFQSL